MTPSKSEVTTITFTSNGNLFTLSGEEIVEKVIASFTNNLTVKLTQLARNLILVMNLKS